MMIKRLAICFALAGTPQFAAAQSVQDQIISQLQAQGFSEITLNRTWLGRVRVVAFRDDLRRELVFNPQTGEILRDYWRSIDDEDDDNGRLRLFNPGGGGSGSGGGQEDGGGNDDDEDDDDEDDDDEDDDEDDDDDDDDDEEDDGDDEDDDDES